MQNGFLRRLMAGFLSPVFFVIQGSLGIFIFAITQDFLVQVLVNIGSVFLVSLIILIIPVLKSNRLPLLIGVFIGLILILIGVGSLFGPAWRFASLPVVSGISAPEVPLQKGFSAIRFSGGFPRYDRGGEFWDAKTDKNGNRKGYDVYHAIPLTLKPNQTKALFYLLGMGPIIPIDQTTYDIVPIPFGKETGFMEAIKESRQKREITIEENVPGYFQVPDWEKERDAAYFAAGGYSLLCFIILFCFGFFMTNPVSRGKASLK